MAVVIKAPHPGHKDTFILPNPEFEDVRASESTITIKRTKTGRKITYPQPSDRITLTLPFQLTRKKSLEVQALVNSYQSAYWHITLEHDESQWEAQLVGAPVIQTASERISEDVDSDTGRELVGLTLTLSAKKLN